MDTYTDLLFRLCLARGHSVMPGRSPQEYLVRLAQPKKQTHEAPKREQDLPASSLLGSHAEVEVSLPNNEGDLSEARGNPKYLRHGGRALQDAQVPLLHCHSETRIECS